MHQCHPLERGSQTISKSIPGVKPDLDLQFLALGFKTCQFFKFSGNPQSLQTPPYLLPIGTIFKHFFRFATSHLLIDVPVNKLSPEAPMTSNF